VETSGHKNGVGWFLSLLKGYDTLNKRKERLHQYSIGDLPYSLLFLKGRSFQQREQSKHALVFYYPAKVIKL
jgi:hypothetical protein